MKLFYVWKYKICIGIEENINIVNLVKFLVIYIEKIFGGVIISDVDMWYGDDFKYCCFFGDGL